MSTVLRRTNFSDLFLADALPALVDVATDAMNRFPKEFENLFNIKEMDRGIAQYASTTGIPAAPQVGEGEEFYMDGPVQGFSRTMLAIKFGVMIACTQELLDDNKYSEALDRAEALGASVDETQQIHAAGIFNNAFTGSGVLGSDGQPLCSATHPLEYPGLGTSSNLLSTPSDLSLSAIEDAVTLMRGTLDRSGKKVSLRAQDLVVPASLEFLAHELTQSEMKPQAATNNNITEVNATNSLRSRYGLKPTIMDYITDDDAWFLMANKKYHKIIWNWRKRPALRSWIKEETETGIIKVSTRFVCDFADWRGIVGTPGNG